MKTDMPPTLRQVLIDKATEGMPHEIGGFIMSDWTPVFFENVARDTKREFAIDDLTLLDFYFSNPRPLGFFHSHPRGREEPSNTDIEHAPFAMRYWIITPLKVVEWDLDHGAPVLVS